MSQSSFETGTTGIHVASSDDVNVVSWRHNHLPNEYIMPLISLDSFSFAVDEMLPTTTPSKFHTIKHATAKDLREIWRRGVSEEQEDGREEVRAVPSRTLARWKPAPAADFGGPNRTLRARFGQRQEAAYISCRAPVV